LRIKVKVEDDGNDEVDKSNRKGERKEKIFPIFMDEDEKQSSCQGEESN
jgi:hypothetical protein